MVQQMLASDVEPTRLGGRWRPRDLLILTVKAAVTAACFWYIFGQIELDRFVRSAMSLQIGWVILATLAISTQIPLVGIRWSAIVNALTGGGRKLSLVPAIAITMTGAFFGQVLPYAAGEAARAWLLVQHGHDWRTSVVSVLIDRAVGVGVLCTLSFVILLLPAAAATLGGHRATALLAFGAMLALGATGLLAAPWLAPRLERWRLTRWISSVAVDAHRCVLRSGRTALMLTVSVAVHALAILAIWALARAQGLALSQIDVAILFVVMIASAVFPFSIGGWGVREVAVISLLSTQGIPAERALFLSVCFGVVLIVATIPGAVAWFLIRPEAGRSTG